METFIGTPRVVAPVLRRLAVSQLRSGGFTAKENGTATQSKAYRALNAWDGRAPTSHLGIIFLNENGPTLHNEARSGNHQTEERSPRSHPSFVGLPCYKDRHNERDGIRRDGE